MFSRWIDQLCDRFKLDHLMNFSMVFKCLSRLMRIIFIQGRRYCSLYIHNNKINRVSCVFAKFHPPAALISFVAILCKYLEAAFCARNLFIRFYLIMPL